MPKKIDHQAKKEEIAESAWQIILRSGMKGVTVRNVASEADLSLGSLRHYFPTQTELLDYLVELSQRRWAERAEKILEMDIPIKEKALEFFGLLLPIDDTSYAVIDIWFSYITHLYQTKSPYDRTADPIYKICLLFFQKLSDSGVLKPELELKNELDRILSLTDGIAIHELTTPNRKKPEDIKKCLALHLESLYQ